MKSHRRTLLQRASPIRTAFTACSLAFAVLNLSACDRTTSNSSSSGSETPPGGAEVVRVGRNVLGKAALEHWTAIEGVLTYRYRPKRPLPKGLVPDPPSYGNCIAYLSATANTTRGQPRPTTTSLKKQCALTHEQTQHHILDILITDYWVKEEAVAKGVKVTAQEIRRVLDREFPSRAERHSFLAITGEHASDQRFLTESKLLLEKLQRRVSPLPAHAKQETEQMAAEVDLSIARLGDDMTKRWTPLTSCRAGYVVSECRQYSQSKLGP